MSRALLCVSSMPLHGCHTRLPATAWAEGFGRPVPLPPDTQLNAPPSLLQV